MDKPSFKLVGSPCGQHGQYTFYKALRITGERERIIAIGDFFFVRIWQDSELVSVGELQLLWTDRVSDQTLVSLRLYFLPENTPDGRNQHGQDEVLAISDKVVLRADDLLSWVCAGHAWEWGLRAVWRGACAPPAARGTQPLHHTRLDFSDVEREKSAISEDVDSPGVVVFSYPRYCRYRALLCRLEGLQGDWLRDSLVAALGGYAAPTKNTRILYCKDTFEYPELEGHEFVCNQLAPRLKGRPRGRRRRRADRPSSPSSRSSDSERAAPPRRLSLRNGAPKYSEDEEEQGSEDSAFIHKLKQFCRERKETFKPAHSLKDLSLRALYASVTAAGGYEAACARRLWRRLHPPRPNTARRHYERYLLPLEQHEVSTGVLSLPAVNGRSPIPTIELADSPPPPPLPALPPARSPRGETDCEPGEPVKDFSVTSKPAEELNREFLESLPKEENKVKISVKPVEKLLEEGKKEEREGGGYPELKNKLNPGAVDKTFQSEVSPQQDLASNALSSLSNLVNGHGLPKDQSRPAGRSSLRAVRVKPARAAPHTPRTTPEAAVTNFGIHHPAPPSDDEIVEVPYKPATPEIIDLDAYPESPQLQVLKKQKLDILKERGLEVTALPPWPPQVPPQVLPQVFQLYSLQPYADAPPKVIQATSAYGTSGPERTVYGNPRDPFMPPPHVVLGAPRAPRPQAPARVLDLTCRAPPYTLLDGKAVVGSNLEITLVDPKPAPGKRGPQKRSSNGKFVSLKPPKESPTKPAIVVPSFQVSQDRAPSAGPRDPQNPFKGQHSPLDLQPPFVDPAYMSALYSSLAGSMDQRQLALYREFVAHQFRGYSGLLGVTPTTKN